MVCGGSAGAEDAGVCRPECSAPPCSAQLLGHAQCPAGLCADVGPQVSPFSSSTFCLLGKLHGGLRLEFQTQNVQQPHCPLLPIFPLHLLSFCRWHQRLVGRHARVSYSSLSRPSSNATAPLRPPAEPGRPWHVAFLAALTSVAGVTPSTCVTPRSAQRAPPGYGRRFNHP